MIDSPLDVLFGGTTPTRLILLILLAFSLASWVLIIWKWRELRAVNEQADRFVDAVEGARGLLDYMMLSGGSKTHPSHAYFVKE